MHAFQALTFNYLQERSTGNKYFEQENLALQFKLDNELDLVFAVVFQKVIQLTYVDTFLADLQQAFKRKFGDSLLTSAQKLSANYEFDKEFRATLSHAEKSAKSSNKASKPMRSFEESLKSKKTVASMIEDKDAKKTEKKVNIQESPPAAKHSETTVSNEDIIMQNRKKLMMGKMGNKKSPPESKKSNAEKEKAGKKPRVWDLGGNSKDAVVLDRSKDQPEDVQYQKLQSNVRNFQLLHVICI